GTSARYASSARAFRVGSATGASSIVAANPPRSVSFSLGGWKDVVSAKGYANHPVYRFTGSRGIERTLRIGNGSAAPQYRGAIEHIASEPERGDPTERAPIASILECAGILRETRQVRMLHF